MPEGGVSGLVISGSSAAVVEEVLNTAVLDNLIVGKSETSMTLKCC